MRGIAFTQTAFDEYNEWFETDGAVIDRIKVLIRDINRDPFRGIGKPEPLCGNWDTGVGGLISRPGLHKITSSQILIAKCKGHY